MIEEYTKLSPITKTIQFELKPVGNTRNTIRTMKHLETDAKFREQAAAAQPYIDEYIKHIADESLTNVSCSNACALITMAENLVKEGEKPTKDQKKKIRDAKTQAEKLVQKAVQESVKAALPGGAKLKDLASEKFIHTYIHDFSMSDPYCNSIFDELKGKTALLSKFLTSRITALDTWMPDRVIENMHIYLDNAKKLETIMGSPVSGEVLISHPDIEIYQMGAAYDQCLRQGGIDAYNRMISGEMDGEIMLMKGVNSIVNEYNHSIRGQKNVHSLPRLKKLNKQILFPGTKLFTVPFVSNDDEARAVIADAHAAFEYVSELSEALRETSTQDIFISGKQVHRLSHLLYGDHHKLTNIMAAVKEKELREAHGKKAMTKTLQNKIDNIPMTIKKQNYTMKDISEYAGDDLHKMFAAHFASLVVTLDSIWNDCNNICKNKLPIKGSERNLEIVQDYFNTWTDIRDAVRIIARNSEEDIDNDFYDAWQTAYEETKATYKAENMIQSYAKRAIGQIVRKQLAHYGAPARHTSKWALPNEKVDVGNNVLIRMDGRFYFFCLPKGEKPVYLDGNDTSCELLTARTIASVDKNVPRFAWPKEVKAFFEENPDAQEYMSKIGVLVPRSAYEAYTGEAYKKKNRDKVGEETYKNALFDLLSYYIPCMKARYPDRVFPFKPADAYDSTDEFYQDIKSVATISAWMPGNRELIETMVKDGKALLFEITSSKLRKYYETQDESRLDDYARTLLFLLSEENQKHNIMKLNSRPQLMYRPAAEGEPIRHKKGSVLVNRHDVNGDWIPDDIRGDIYRCLNGRLSPHKISDEAKRYLNENLVVSKEADHEIVKDGRFYKEQFSVVFSYTKNPTVVAQKTRVRNEMIREISEDCNRIILIRNTQDTVFMSVRDKNGAVLEERSLNIIDGTDYHKRLKDLEEESRDRQKHNWENKKEVKNLRDGYFTKAIKEVVDAVRKYDAIIVTERVGKESRDKWYALGNTAFKKFEKMLCSRLGDLHFSDIAFGCPGSLTNPYQLADPDGGMDFQNGIVFFVSGYGITETDPASGFHCDFQTYTIQNKTSRLMFLSRFDKIKYDKTTKELEVAFDYDKFSTSGAPTQAHWNMKTSNGIVLFNREYKYNTYIEHPFDDVADALEQEGHDPERNIRDIASEGNLSKRTTDLIFERLLKILRGSQGTHDGKRRMYASPVTGEIIDESVCAATNLNQRFDCFCVEWAKKRIA